MYSVVILYVIDWQGQGPNLIWICIDLVVHSLILAGRYARNPCSGTRAVLTQRERERPAYPEKLDRQIGTAADHSAC